MWYSFFLTFSKCLKSRLWTNVLSPSAPKIGRNTPFLLYIHAHMPIVDWEGEKTTAFLCCSSLALEPGLKNKFPGPPPQHFHLLDHSWKCSRDFSFPSLRCYRFYRWISETASCWKVRVDLPAVWRNSMGGYPPSHLPGGQTLLRGCFALILKIREASTVQLAPPWSQGHWLCTWQVRREAGQWLGLCLCPRAAVDCKLLFCYANVLCSSQGFDLGTSRVLITGWGSLALKILQSAHHNMHGSWYILLLLKHWKGYTNCLPWTRISLAPLTHHQRAGLPCKAENIVDSKKSKQTIGVIAKKAWDQRV